jgi:hypothetical protein
VPAMPPVPPAPPTPPPSVAVPPGEATVRRYLDLARSFALLIALIAGVLFLVLLALTILAVVFGGSAGGFVSAAYCLVAAAVNYLLWREIRSLESLALARQYAALRDRMLLWVVLGFVFFVVEGIILAVVWLKVEALLHPEGAVSQVIGAPPGTSPPAPISTMCPRCGLPASYLADSRRYYCPRCSQYL